MYKKISFRSVSKPGPGNRAGFFIARTLGTQKRLGFWGLDAGGPQTQAFSGRRLPAPPPQNQQRSEDNAQFRKGQSGNPAGRPPSAGTSWKSDVRLRVRHMIAQGKAHPDERFFYVRGGAKHASCRACYVPVRGAAGFAFCQPAQIDDEGSL
jgi:hypothetical protein